jgi:hypothetical protein
MHEIRAESCRCGSNSSMHRADDKPAEAGGTWITWDNGISLICGISVETSLSISLRSQALI